jgi:hypothetical protein
MLSPHTSIGRLQHLVSARLRRTPITSALEFLQHLFQLQIEGSRNAPQRAERGIESAILYRGDGFSRKLGMVREDLLRPVVSKTQSAYPLSQRLAIASCHPLSMSLC